MKPIIIIFFFIIINYFPLSGQTHLFTRQDTLRGSITPERKWWDLTYYHLDITVNPSDSTINGTNEVIYRVINQGSVMQIDLQPPMVLQAAKQNKRELKITHDGNAHFIHLAEEQTIGSVNSITIFFGGRPQVAARPPWDGGIVWNKDRNGKPFIASACQGDGASLWWPCKDHQYDEPDSMMISLTVPSDLSGVSNGRLKSVKSDRKRKTRTFNWFVSCPINNYGVNINVGDYVSFSEKFAGEKGNLNCHYWVLKDNLELAKKQFSQVPMMLKAFEHWFGPYPFYKDSYKLVEVPYLGMEHQSSVTYGNGYRNGYLGTDLSGTGWGNTWDFIIVHESGHEWFGNSITSGDIADMWVHESFINYSESLFTEYYNGKEAGAEYVRGTRRKILNDRPVTGIYNVNSPGSKDMYYKGGNMLHTLRQIINDDNKWREILRGLNSEFYHQVVEGSQVEDYIIRKTDLDLGPFFDQYLRDTRIPVFEYFIQDNRLTFRWNNCVEGFNMPLKIWIDGKDSVVNPLTEWESITIENGNAKIEPDKDYYVAVMNMMGR